MANQNQHDVYDQAYTAYQTGRSRWRQWIRDYYLKIAASYAIGPSLDFGCGIGELLQRLPKQSLGIEYNRSTVDYCQQMGLNVVWYDGFADDFSLKNILWTGHCSTLYLSHVLEHFEDPAYILTHLAETLESETQRIVIILPGMAGFKMDTTHRTFVDYPMLEQAVSQMTKWKIYSTRYFPFNSSFVGRFFPYNELHVILDRA